MNACQRLCRFAGRTGSLLSPCLPPSHLNPAYLDAETLNPTHPAYLKP